ncbi:type I toxin-antitoxin system Hok family toxin [Escherichia coli]|nr:type I toxin-antitoxin system Hok family toxin [Escherichia coli]
MKPQEIFLSILGLPLRASTTRMVVPSSLGFTLLVGDSLCEFTVKERNIEFKAVLAYEPKK